MKYLLNFKLFEKKNVQVQVQPTEKEIKKRWKKKRTAIETLKNNIQKLRYNLTRDLSSDNEKTKQVAAIVKIMEITAERVGNEASKENGHHGVTNLKKKHIKVSGNSITLTYKGKSGVDHTRTFSDAKVAGILKKLMRGLDKEDDVFVTSGGLSIKSNQVNDYLKKFNITSKDIRGFKANELMKKKLRGINVKEEKDIKKKFNEVLREVAEKIGHLPGTLRKHYLLPEIEENFYKYGNINKLK